jgi:hypothetical protein
MNTLLLFESSLLVQTRPVRERGEVRAPLRRLHVLADQGVSGGRIRCVK